jgi:hypothetical protein
MSKIKQSKMTKLARGSRCYLHLDQNCQSGGETTVFAHLGISAMGMKNRVGGIDFGCPACFNCHNLVDGRTQADPPLEREWMELCHLRGTISYMRLMAKEGIIKV